ncbi:hypothetical protein HDU96_008233 [Phlyctochytrium bullatum]|nr:hypothetical protein HDU96_008233 [Phlyctochytrium bullatum]
MCAGTHDQRNPTVRFVDDRDQTVVSTQRTQRESGKGTDSWSLNGALTETCSSEPSTKSGHKPGHVGGVLRFGTGV